MKKAVVVCCVLFLSLGAFALDLKSGSMLLSVDERSGTFKIYQLSEDQKTRTSLLYEQDTRTSYVLVTSGNRTLKLNDNFSAKIEATETGVKIIYTADVAVVTLEVTPQDQSGFMFLYTMLNNGKSEISMGCRVLLDSYLGEKNNLHFKTGSNPQIQTEVQFFSTALPSWIESSNEKNVGFRLFVNTNLEYAPDSIMLANWKRINDAVWQPEFQQNRNFTLAPYSINDSAIALYWDPKTVRAQESRKIIFYIGNTSVVSMAPVAGATFIAATSTPSETTTPATTQIQAFPPATQAQILELLQKDYQSALTIMQMINNLLASGKTVTEADLAKIQAMIDELSKRKGQY